MRKQGIDVKVLSPLHAKSKFMLAPAKLFARTLGKSITLDHFHFVLRDYASQIEKWVRAHQIDVIFSPSTIPITLLNCDQPIVTWTDAVFHSMHGYYGKGFAKMTSSAVARGKWQEEEALRNCQISAFASTWALEGARTFADNSKLRLLLFGSSLPVHHTVDEIAQLASRKRVMRTNKCELLFVGADWERKGGSIAIETAKLLNDSGIETRLRVVGSKPKAEVPEYVELLGFVDKSSASGEQCLIELFRSADVFILPTNAEAAGIVFAEASSYGLPSVTYATGGVTDYVRSDVNGKCIEPGASAARFAQEILSIVERRAEYVSYAVRAFEEYRQRLNWESSVRELIDLCRQCASTSSSSDL
jgi:glycosyltransferase involved in cell wall biosynthesis